jgi:hypothetical protein
VQRLISSISSMAVLIAGVLAFSVIGMTAANAACTSFTKTATYSSAGQPSGYRIVGYNNCATGVFRADIAWAADTDCATIHQGGSHTWYVGLQRGDVRGIVGC